MHSKKIGIVVLLLAAGTFAGAASAQNNETRSAKYVLSHCLQASDPQDAISGRCAGVMATLSFVSRVLPDNLKFCHPTSATPEQMTDVIARFVEANPDSAAQDFRLVALAAMRDKWPCEE